MKTLTFEQAVSVMEENLPKSFGKCQTLAEFKRAAVKNFDLFAAYDTYLRIHFQDFDVWGSDGYKALNYLWEKYSKTAWEYKNAHKENLALCGHQTIDGFRDELGM